MAIINVTIQIPKLRYYGTFNTETGLITPDLHGEFEDYSNHDKFQMIMPSGVVVPLDSGEDENDENAIVFVVKSDADDT